MEYPIYFIDRFPTCSSPEGDCEFYNDGDLFLTLCTYKDSEMLGMWNGKVSGKIKPKDSCPFHDMSHFT